MGHGHRWKFVRYIFIQLSSFEYYLNFDMPYYCIYLDILWYLICLINVHACLVQAIYLLSHCKFKIMPRQVTLKYWGYLNEFCYIVYVAYPTPIFINLEKKEKKYVGIHYLNTFRGGGTGYVRTCKYTSIFCQSIEAKTFLS